MTGFWENRRVFVTGHTGFKGGWLTYWLYTLKAHVRGYALDPVSAPNLFETLRLGELIDDVRGDIRDQASLTKALHDFQPEAVFHLAAQPLVRQSYVDPVGTYATNVLGTAHLLESVRQIPSVRCVIVVTTDKCYRNNEWAWGYREADHLGGHDPYSSSKACVEILTASYRDSFFPVSGFATHRVGIATARAGNVIGGGDWSEDRLVPDLIRGFLRREPVRIRYPNATRPWQHVLEPLAGYLMLGQKLLAGESRFADAWNFGPSDESVWPVSQIASAMAEKWGQGAGWIRDEAPNWHEANYLKLDASKARAELHWKPQLTMTETLNWIAEWFQAWDSHEEMRAITSRQISNYEERSR